jgi:hypothetical protein
MVRYGPEQREMLHEAGLLDGQTVHGSLAPGALPTPPRPTAGWRQHDSHDD